jgi:predicted MFS family arabinose efflux permease
LGATIVVAYKAVLEAYAAPWVTPLQRVQAVGTACRGIVLDILLARFTSGLIADLAGWCAVYFVSSGLMPTIAVVLWKVVPVAVSPRNQPTYQALIRSFFKLFMTEPVLRIRSLLSAA